MRFFWYTGGQNNQILVKAGIEANLDVQFALGISFPIPGAFYSTGGQPPFIPDNRTLINTNEPYLTVCMESHCTALVLVIFRVCVPVVRFHTCTERNTSDHLHELW
jgi:hypothetical protein